MKYRKLGSTGIIVSEIGFGAWGIGGDSYGTTDDNESLLALRHAFENGVNFFDTSDLYGAGHSEKLIGQAFKGMRDQVVIASKVGTLPHNGFHMPQDFTATHIRQSLEKTLANLKTDYLDLYQLHSPPSEIIVHCEEAVSELEKAKQKGMIKSFGISVRSPDDGILAARGHCFDVIQVNFNLIDQRVIDNGLLEYANANGVGVIARTPLCFGYLSGGLTGSETFKGKDHRNNWPEDQLIRWANAHSDFSFLCEENKRSPSQAALLFCLAFKEISTVIPGMLKISEVEENTAVSNLDPLNEIELAQVIRIYQDKVYYDNTSKQRGKQ